MEFKCQSLIKRSPSRRAIPRSEDESARSHEKRERAAAGYLERMGIKGDSLQEQMMRFEACKDEIGALPEGVMDELRAGLRAIEEKYSDPRDDDFITYPLAPLILIIIFAACAGITEPKSIREYIERNMPAICVLLEDEWPGPEYVPSASTIYRALKIMGSDECREFFAEHFSGRLSAWIHRFFRQQV